jgi:hypothetical protein
MKKHLLSLTLALLSMAALAQHSDKDKKEDTAKCLEAGKKEEVCMAELQTACKGLAIGKYCGMRHVH